MARTIEQIKKEMTEAFMVNETLANAYGFNEGDSFSSKFSKVSIESVLMYIVAASIWVLEKIFDAHQTEITSMIASMKPHTLRWYVNKVKAYRKGQELIEGTTEYSNENLSDEDIEQMQIVKYAAATESEGVVYIKVATGEPGNRSPLSEGEKEGEVDELSGLKAYISEIKDAGVQYVVINEPASKLKLELNIYYNPMVLSNTGEHLSLGGNPVKDSIKGYINSLPFNGEYRNQSLIDALQVTEGVVIAELVVAEESYDGKNFVSINAKATPYSGYYKYDEDDITINYKAYEGNRD